MRERRNKLRREEDVKKDEIVTEIAHPNPAMRPARRAWVAVLFFCLCVGIGLSYYGLQKWTKSVQQNACNRANDVRKESNQRINSHIRDEENFLTLLRAITHTREVEANAWQNLNNIIIKATPPSRRQAPIFKKYETNIEELIVAYKLARKRDRAIETSENKIHYDKLNIVNCKKIV